VHYTTASVHVRDAAAQFDAVGATRQVVCFPPSVIVSLEHDHNVLVTASRHDEIFSVTLNGIQRGREV
jgi:hypothetical protein